MTTLALAAVYLIWGSTYWVMKVAFAELPQLFGSGTRFVVAGCILFGVQRARGAAWPTRSQWLYAAPVGTLMFLSGNGTVAIVGRYIPSGVIAVVAATMPLWAAGMARFFGERVKAQEWAAMAIGLCGVAVLSLGPDLQANPFMTLLLFFAPLGWALGSMFARKLPLAPGPMSAATQMITGGSAMAAAGLLRGEQLPHAVSATALYAFAYLVVFGSLVAFTAYSYLLRTVRPALSMSYAYVNPVIAVAVGNVLGGEAVRPQSIVATVLIVVAVVLAVRK